MFKKETCKGGVIIPKSRRSTLASQNTTQTTTRSDNEISSRLNNRINDTLNSLASLQNINDNNSLNTGGIIDTQYISDREEEIIRDNIHNNFEDDEYFYADNEEAFIEELERAKTEDLEYEYSNVLNGSNNTFGVELEFIGGDPNQIANELYQLDICGYDRQVHYHAPSISGKWKLERDVSLPTGGELVSPPLKDTPETWRNLEKVCEVAKRHGANVRSRACGAHVHTGSDPLDTAKYRWERLLKSTGSFEDVIYRMSGGERGIVRDGVRTYARRFSQNALMGLNSNFEMENSIDLRSFTRNVSRLDRYQSINLT
ncbi:MAG: amidoligase family protein, partial [Clostridiales bacterium]